MVIGRRITQDELAERIGTSASAISRIESGQHVTSVRILERLGGGAWSEAGRWVREGAGTGDLSRSRSSAIPKGNDRCPGAAQRVERLRR